MIYDSFEQIPHVLQSQLSFAIRESTSASIGKDGLVGGNSSDRALLSFLDKDALKAITAFCACFLRILIIGFSFLADKV